MTRAVVFAYHNVGVRCLSVLAAHGIDIALVVTHKDNPAENIWFDSVARWATDHDIPIITPADPNTPDVLARIHACSPDFLFSFYYRHMLDASILATPKRGAYNLHGSLLPQYRGRVPVNWAVLHGERRTGATLHAMVEKPDAGDIVAQQAVPILPDDTAFDVFQKVTLAAEMALDSVIDALIAGTAPHQPQNLSQGRYFGGRKAEDGRIDWTASAQQIHNLVRAVAPPYPGAFSDLGEHRLRILATRLAAGVTAPVSRPALFTQSGALFARCGDGQCLKIVQAELDGTPLHAATLQATLGTDPLYLEPEYFAPLSDKTPL